MPDMPEYPASESANAPDGAEFGRRELVRLTPFLLVKVLLIMLGVERFHRTLLGSSDELHRYSIPHKYIDWRGHID